jgi:uncharacterized membrane protein YhaH (DUF805 family)
MNGVSMNWFIKCLKLYAQGKGRARRKEYWMFVLIYFIIAFSLAFIEILVTGDANSDILVSIFYLAMFLPLAAVGIRRMHDVGKSGWFLIIPIYNLILAVTEGESGDNKYGPDPKMEPV